MIRRIPSSIPHKKVNPAKMPKNEIVAQTESSTSLNLQKQAVAATVSSQLLTLEELWDARQKAMSEEPNNKEQWDEVLTPDEARVAKEMVLHALHTLAEDLEWVPYRTEIKDGQILDINLRILLTDVDEEVRRQEAEFLATVDQVRHLQLPPDEEEEEVATAA